MSRLYNELNTRLGCRGLCIKNKQKERRQKQSKIDQFIGLLVVYNGGKV